MLDDQAIDRLATAVAALQQGPASAGAWPALRPLARLGRDAAVVIDFRASTAVGAPVVVVQPVRNLAALLAPLTPRQRQVAHHVIAGQPNKRIARDLAISVATVKDHVHAILRRLDLASRAELIAAAQST